MIPYSYNMVNMGGIDLAEANGTVVPGVYEKIVEAMNLCGDLILYNWKFAEINIAPSAYSVLQQAHSILINGLIQVTELDQITVIGLPPPLVPVVPLEVTENGLYEAELPASGFNPVRVTVSAGGGDWEQLKVYIESTGNQWVDTGYFVKNNSRFELVANIAPVNSVPCAYGVRQTSSGGAQAQGVWLFPRFDNNNVVYYSWGTDETALESSTPYTNQKSLWCIEQGKVSVEAQTGESKSHVFNGGAVTSQYSLYLFSLNQAGSEFGAVTRCQMKFYRFRIYEGDTLVHEFVPWQENGVACLKDNVTSNLLYNSGTGDFTYGTDDI